MHELGIAINIIRIVDKELAERGITAPVERIGVRVGKLHAIIPASLDFHFSVVRRDYPQLENAALAIEEIPVVARCDTCNTQEPLTTPIFACERCGNPVQVIEGEEMVVTSITV